QPQSANFLAHRLKRRRGAKVPPEEAGRARFYFARQKIVVVFAIRFRHEVMRALRAFRYKERHRGSTSNAITPGQQLILEPPWHFPWLDNVFGGHMPLVSSSRSRRSAPSPLQPQMAWLVAILMALALAPA